MSGFRFIFSTGFSKIWNVLILRLINNCFDFRDAISLILHGLSWIWFFKQFFGFFLNFINWIQLIQLIQKNSDLLHLLVIVSIFFLFFFSFCWMSLIQIIRKFFFCRNQYFWDIVVIWLYSVFQSILSFLVSVSKGIKPLPQTYY